MKTKKMVIIVVCVLIMLLLGIIIYFFTCNVMVYDNTGFYHEDNENELICTVDTQQEAEQLAEAYGIEFVSFSDGVAMFNSIKPYREICEYGKKKGLKELYINYKRQVY